MNPSLRRLILVLVGCLVVAAILLGVWFYFLRTTPPQNSSANKPAGTPASTTGSGSGNTSPRLPASAAANATQAIDFKSELEKARRLRDPRLRSSEFGRILRLWLERDPDAALAYVRTLPSSTSEYTQGILMTIQTFAARDSDHALVLARELAVTREQLAIYNSLFALFAQQNLQSAIQRLTAVPSGVARENAIRALVDTWVRTDLPGALAWAQGLTDTTARATALESVFAELSEKDPLQVLDLAQKNLSGPLRERAMYNALQRLIATDPQSASGFVNLLPTGENQTLAAADVAHALAAQNVSAALAWTKTLSAEPLRAIATKRVLEVWGTSDPAAASRYVAAMPPGPEQQDAANSLARVLAAADPRNAIAWVQTLPAGERRTAALTNVVNTWAQRDPAAASRWVATQTTETLSASAPNALNGALSYWVLQDAAGAQEFVRTLPAGTQPSAAEAIAPLLAQNNPTGALSWAESLPAGDAREGALTGAYSRWHDNAATAAESWLASSNLPPETKARLQKLSAQK